MHTTTVVIGAGHAGLAMSRCLADRSIDHVVLERGEVANSWKTERWDSLRLLTPNWQSRLPGYGYEGDDPDGFRTMAQTIDFIERYADAISAPVQTHTPVRSVRRTDRGYSVATHQGEWMSRTVVLATGACNVAKVPAVATGLPPSIATLTPMQYRNPDQLDEGGVLVVGASASGTQIAEELRQSGRPVTLSVGEHVRVPRVYRGRDIKWWMDTVGALDECYTDVDSIDRVRNVPSLQLAGSDDRRNVDLNALTNIGVKLVGRLAGIADGKAQFSGSLRNLCEMADLKMNRLLDRIDEWVAEHLGDGAVEPPHRFEPTRIEESPQLGMDLASGEVKTIVWATGYRPDYSWLDVPAFDRKGRVKHDGGVVESPGMYLMGLPFLRRRKSSLIDGAGDDARDLSAHLAAYLDGGTPAASSPRIGSGAYRMIRSSWSNPESPTARKRYDVVIAGARCAGASTAMLLARQGLRVLVVDPTRRGSDTLSTHALMRGGVLQLHRWGVLNAVRSAGTPTIRSTTFHYGEEVVEVRIKERDGVDGLYAPRRTVLDLALLEAAEAAGAEVVLAQSVVGLLRGRGDRVTGVRIAGADRHAIEVAADVVIGADGLRSRVARLVGAEVVHTARHATASIYGYQRDLGLEGVHWFYNIGAAVGSIPTNDGDTCVFASLPPARFEGNRKGGLDSLYWEVINHVSPLLAERVASTKASTKLRAFPGQAGFLRRSAGPGWALVGDAAYFKDPLTAHGITDALRDAELLARAVTEGGDDALARYQATRDGLVQGLFEVTDRIASFEWDLEQAKEHHLTLSKEMNAEVDLLKTLDGDFVAAGGGVSGIGDVVPATKLSGVVGRG